MTTYHDMTRHNTTHHHHNTTAISIEQQQWLNHHHHHHNFHNHHHNPNNQQQGEAATAANFMREIAREIEQKRAAIRSALDESRVNELLIELSQNVLNTFLQRTTTTTTQISTSSIPSLLKRSLLITYAYLIEHQNEHDDINNNNLNNTPSSSSSSSSSSTNSFCHLVKNLSKYEQNIATQLNRIYSSVVNLLGDTSVSSSSSSSSLSSTSSISYNNTSYSTAFNQQSSLNDLKMLHFLLILFNSFMNHFENDYDEDEVDENELVNGNLMEDVSVGFIDIDGENLNLDQKYDIINETNNESAVNGGDDEFSFVNLQDMNVTVEMAPPKSSTLFNCVAKTKQTIRNFALEAFECQKFIIKLIDRLLINHGGNASSFNVNATTNNSSRNSKIIKTKILLSIADLDI